MTEQQNHRRNDIIASAILLFTFVYIVLVAVDIAYAQTAQDVINARVDGQINLINYRLDKIETLMYTAIAGTGGNLLAHMAEIRHRYKNRR